MEKTIRLTKEELEDIWNQALLKGYTAGFVDADSEFPFRYEAGKLPKTLRKLFEDEATAND